MITLACLSVCIGACSPWSRDSQLQLSDKLQESLAPGVGDLNYVKMQIWGSKGVVHSVHQIFRQMCVSITV